MPEKLSLAFKFERTGHVRKCRGDNCEKQIEKGDKCLVEFTPFELPFKPPMTKKLSYCESCARKRVREVKDFLLSESHQFELIGEGLRHTYRGLIVGE